MKIEFYKTTEEEDKIINFLSSGEECNIMLGLCFMHEKGCTPYIKDLICKSFNAISSPNYIFGNVADVHALLALDWTGDVMLNRSESICKLLMCIHKYKESALGKNITIGEGIFTNSPALYDFRLFGFNHIVVKANTESLCLLKYGVENGIIPDVETVITVLNSGKNTLDLSFMSDLSLMVDYGCNSIIDIIMPKLLKNAFLTSYNDNITVLTKICNTANDVFLDNVSRHKQFSDEEVEILWQSNANVKIWYEAFGGDTNADLLAEKVKAVVERTGNFRKKKFLILVGSFKRYDSLD